MAKIECQRVVAMATIFWTKTAINWLRVNDSNYAIRYEGWFEWSANRMHILPIPAHKGRCHGKHFLLFGCMISSDTLFDYRGWVFGVDVL